MPSALATAGEELLDWTDENEPTIEPQPEAALIRSLIRTALITIALMASVAMAVAELHYWRLRQEIQRKQTAPVSALLAATKARDAMRMSRYQWVNRPAGVLRIPVAVATELVIADYSRAPAEPTKQDSVSQP